MEQQKQKRGRGRPVIPTSDRQARLARYAEKRRLGIEVKPGRPKGSKKKLNTEVLVEPLVK